MTLYQFAGEQGLTAAEAVSLRDGFGVPEGFALKAHLSDADRSRLQLLVELIRCSDSRLAHPAQGKSDCDSQ